MRLVYSHRVVDLVYSHRAVCSPCRLLLEQYTEGKILTQRVAP